VARFRVNIFIQRGSCAIVMRVIPTAIPNLKTLGAPAQLQEVVAVRNGLVIVTGPRGCGKSSTLAALVNHINETESCHIITIEDPIEFLHNHKRSTVHQRELHSDTPSISHAMRAALRQAPNVIAVGELKDRESMEWALDAAETGHLVLSTVNTLNAAKTVERFVGVFPAAEQSAVRERLSRMLRYVICQRLMPCKENGERVAVYQIVASDALQEILNAEHKNHSKQNELATSAIDLEIERLVRDGTITAETAVANAADPLKLSKSLASN
jgi:twitching motility protein PilT